jgi:hypothetical protein
VNEQLQFTLTIVQIAVALITLGGMFYYAGRHSVKIEQNTADIMDLKIGHGENQRVAGIHTTQIAVLEREVGIDIHRGPIT